MSVRSRSGAKSSGGAVPETENGVKSSISDIISRAIKPESQWPDKDELLDVVYWSRQGFSAVLGVIWGIVPFHGLLAIVLYVAISTLTAYFFVTIYQKVDEDNVGGFWELAKEGFGSGIASFLIAWIVVYSGVHSVLVL